MKAIFVLLFGAIGVVSLLGAEPPLLLKATKLKSIGEENEMRTGSLRTGPTLPAGTRELRVEIDKSLEMDLKITRLYYSKRDLVSMPGRPGFAKGRDVEMWVPQGGVFCQTTLLEDTATSPPGVGVKLTKALKDGVYCIHTGELGKGKEAPAFAAPFVIGGVAELSIAEKKVSFENGKAHLTLTLKNGGGGEFNDGTVTITLQRVNPDKGKSSFTARWGDRLPIVPAQGTATYEREFPASAWVPDSYYFYGHVQTTGSRDDSDNIETYKTEQFVVPKTD